ncbi:chymotrypsinogen A-like [Physella acuta]|uniref:chymotrypsinogen A-like n=1 Tax=Physella acuta TaxID=109671 RepID=UPI0027DC85CD|nr:chymotrypsinogen A-like [Physella acuta]XP_059159016.1 chymotrypsinogen A-like [Physella acuta]XP_059159017.1 chymotrypsinogen A-like [Physella acuta]XP_059159018.1 chymotrypsinogen A-like [Physella acuta]
MCWDKVIQLPLLVYKLLYFWQFHVDAPMVSDMLNQKGCGVSNYNISDLIINGVEAPRHAWPWQVLVLTDQTMCGGSIIDREWILTAAHCITSLDTYVLLGEVDFKQYKSPYRKVVLKVQHPHYSSNPNINDLALLKLSTPIDYSESIRPICLPEGNIWDASPCFITGYGLITRDTHSPIRPDRLMQLRTGIMDPRLCKTMLTMVMLSPHHASYICLDAPEMSEAYKGDSGGPLSCYKNGRFYLLGVTSFVGEDDVAYLFPSIYASVSHYMDWIKLYVDI